jgi:hypothetical protein
MEIAHGVTSPALHALVTEIEETRQRRIAGVTIADLMPARALVTAAPGDERAPAEPEQS